MQELVAKKMIMHMSTINSNTTNITNEKENSNNKEDDQDVALPGFRFHPTDEELVGFYLQRKVEKKPISIELIKQIDIYKYDPWDLPKVGNVGDKEWYFFCKRGRKYRNSIRPNRVTGSGFWKATGIDKPIYSAKEPHDCIGLKKSLVYYRGSAGKGTKTDWMMHEFRLPLNPNNTDSNFANASKADNNVDVAQEAEVWTLCRIFKRISSYKKYSTMIPADHNNNNNGKESSTTLIKSSSMSLLSIPVDDSSSKTCSLETDYVSPCYRNKRSKPVNSDDHPQSLHDSDREASIITHKSWFNLGQYYNNNHVPHTASHHQHQAPIMCPGSNYPSYYPSFNLNPSQADHDFFTNESWDELRSVVQFAVDRHPS